jgi:hypothetical protein
VRSIVRKRDPKQRTEANMAKIVKLNEGQLRKVVRRMLSESFGAELPRNHKMAANLMGRIARSMGVGSRDDVELNLDAIVEEAEGSLTTSMQRMGYKPAMLTAFNDLVAGDYGDLADLVWAEVSTTSVGR